MSSDGTTQPAATAPNANLERTRATAVARATPKGPVLSQEEIAKLDAITEQRKKEQNYVQIEDKTRVLFFPNATDFVMAEKAFGSVKDAKTSTRVTWKVIDPNLDAQDLKEFTTSLRLGEDIAAQLKLGNKVLQITRKGTGTNTEYTVVPTEPEWT
ncbi:MAG: hypothetical protein ACREAY_01795 [Nitrososphaera sp.]|uniref:hypothetical protein n=1 Tax=Nitrososphaera sp. TaxID=1971748 RepID=UPI003D6F8FC4